ncbi:MAG: hypothetical protein HUU37_03365, partial [Bdellovibrionales bacterium]|nr:hypothetical protein [Bdellovibrionales bacterium]
MPNPQRPFQLWLAFLLAYFCICACSLSARADLPTAEALRGRIQAILAAE